MSKFKVRKAAKKRFKITKNGKVLFAHQMKRHLRRKKTGSNLRKKHISGEMHGKFATKIKQMAGA